MDDLGLSFAPTAQNQQQGNGGSAATPIQDAIKVLNLRIPTVHGAIPSPLMNAPGGAGIPNIGVGGLEQWLRMLFGQQGPLSAGGMTAGAPLPNVTPGAGGPKPDFPMPPAPPIPNTMPNEPAPGSFQPGGFAPETPQAPPMPRSPFGGNRDWLGGGMRNQS